MKLRLLVLAIAAFLLGVSLLQMPVAAQRAPYIGLRDLGDALGIRIGTTDDSWGDFRYDTTVPYDFNLLSSGQRMKMHFTHPCPPLWLIAANPAVAAWVALPGDGCTGQASEEWNFAPADQMMDYAEANDMKVFGHSLVWHLPLNLPGWVLEGNLNPGQKRVVLENHIKTVMRYFCRNYPGTVIKWDVVNESIGNNGQLYASSVWYDAGYSTELTAPDNIIGLAFYWADQARSHTDCAGQDIELVFNQHLFEDADVRSAVLQVMAAYPRIDQLGMQQHIWIYRTTPMDPLAAGSPIQYMGNGTTWGYARDLDVAGIEWALTETDVTINNWNGSPTPSPEPAPTLYPKQAEYYGHLVYLCRVTGSCDQFTTWGTEDGGSWRNDMPPFVHDPDPLMYLHRNEHRYYPAPIQACGTPRAVVSANEKFCPKPYVYSKVYGVLQ
jgi:GH35 family endo-1,4-beta-xylanase